MAISLTCSHLIKSLPCARVSWLALCVDMFHHDRHHDGHSFGCVFGDLRRVPRHSRAAESPLLLPTVARLCRGSDGVAHHTVLVVCWSSSGSLLGSVSTSVLFVSIIRKCYCISMSIRNL